MNLLFFTLNKMTRTQTTLTFEANLENDKLYCSEDDQYRICEIDSLLIDSVARISFTTPKYILNKNKFKMTDSDGAYNEITL